MNTSVGCGCVSATAVPDGRVEWTRQEGRAVAREVVSISVIENEVKIQSRKVRVFGSGEGLRKVARLM